MRVQLVLGALVSLATAFYYPSISDDQDQSKNHQEQDYNRQSRYLWINQSNTSPYYSLVMNATTLALGALYYGSIGLGMWSVLNEASNTVAKHKALKAKLQIDDSGDHGLGNDFQYSDLSEVSGGGDYAPSATNEAELEEYEKQLKEYEQAYEAYLASYKDWAEKYGMDPNPPDLNALVDSEETRRRKRYQISSLHRLLQAV